MPSLYLPPYLAYRDSTLIMQLLRENLALWEEEVEAGKVTGNGEDR